MRAWLSIFGPIVIALAPIARADNCNNAPDQTSMNECSAKASKRADDELNLLYQRIMGRLKEGGADSADTRTALVAAQRAWIAFREAECAFVGSRTAGGTIGPTIVASCLTDLANDRINDFKRYLKCKEGDLSCPLPPK